MNIVHIRVISHPRIYNLNVMLGKELDNQWKPFNGLYFDQKTKCFTQVIIKKEESQQ